MEIVFTQRAEEDLDFWRQGNQEKVRDRIAKLLASIAATPFKGLGKPEPLRHDLSGYWSRRINKEHRLVYGVEDGVITVISVRFHY